MELIAEFFYCIKIIKFMGIFNKGGPNLASVVSKNARRIPEEGSREFYRSWWQPGVGEYGWASPLFVVELGVFESFAQSMARVIAERSDDELLKDVIANYEPLVMEYIVNQTFCVYVALSSNSTRIPEKKIFNHKFRERQLKEASSNSESLAVRFGNMWIESIWHDLNTLVSSTRENFGREKEFILADAASDIVYRTLVVMSRNNEIKLKEWADLDREIRGEVLRNFGLYS